MGRLIYQLDLYTGKYGNRRLEKKIIVCKNPSIISKTENDAVCHDPLSCGLMTEGLAAVCLTFQDIDQ